MLAHHAGAIAEATDALASRLREYEQLPRSPANTFNLHAVLLHGGGALSGHYWAYVCLDERWWMFNDARVTPIDDIDAQLVKAEANIYCLMYRRAEQATEQTPSNDD